MLGNLFKHRMKHVNRLLIFLFCAFVLLGNTTIQAQAGPPHRVFVLGEPDVRHFPEVRLDFRPLDIDNKLARPTEETLTLFEAGQPLTDFVLATGERAPIQLVFVVDQGRHFNPQRLGGSLLSGILADFVLSDRGYFREGVDRVAILSRENEGADQTNVVLPPTQSATDFLTAVNTLEWRNTGQTDGLAGVADGLAQFVGGQGEMSTAVIYIGSLIDDPHGWNQAAADRARPLAVLAREKNITIHAIHTERDGAYASPLQTLSDVSGGQYIHLRDTVDAQTAFRPLYDDILAQSETYRLTYRSQSGDSGRRQVVLLPQTVSLDNAPVESQTSYEVTLSPPEVTIRYPQMGQLLDRGGAHDEAGNPFYVTDQIEVAVELAWAAERPPTEIVEVTFLVNGEPSFSVRPEMHDNRLTIPWDIRAYQDQLASDVVLEVMLKDELGFEGVSSPVQVTIDGLLLSPTAVVPELSATISEPLPAGSCTAGWFRWPCLSQVVLPWLLVLCLLIVAIFLLVWGLRYRDQLAQVVQKPLDLVRKTMLGGGNRGRTVIAKIYIEQGGKAVTGQTIDLYTNKTTLGRNPKLCDIQLYDEDYVSTVSGLHCTIQYDAVQQLFFVTDDHSANGTYLNEQLLEATMPYPLKRDDWLVLGDLFRQGAKIRFEPVAAGQDVASAASTTPPNGQIGDSEMQPFDVGATELFVDGPDLRIDSFQEIPVPTPSMPVAPLNPSYPAFADDEDESWLDDL